MRQKQLLAQRGTIQSQNKFLNRIARLDQLQHNVNRNIAPCEIDESINATTLSSRREVNNTQQRNYVMDFEQGFQPDIDTDLSSYHKGTAGSYQQVGKPGYFKGKRRTSPPRQNIDHT